MPRAGLRQPLTVRLAVKHDEVEHAGVDRSPFDARRLDYEVPPTALAVPVSVDVITDSDFAIWNQIMTGPEVVERHGAPLSLPQNTSRLVYDQ